MEHKAYKRVKNGAELAVLFIHGIVGTPNHFDMVVPLVPENVSLYNLLLDGHGKSPKDFGNTSMKKWEAQVQKAVDELSASHERIYIVGHSMGCLYAIEQAMQNKKVAKLFLLAVPLKLCLRPAMVTNAWKVFRNRVDRGDPVAWAAKKSYGIEQDQNILHYIGWIPRYLELFGKIRSVRGKIGALSTDCVAFQSRKDEMVSVKTAKILQENPWVSLVELEHSGHYYYEKDDLALLVESFQKWLV